MPTVRTAGIRVAQSSATDGAAAIRELLEELDQENLELVAFFCSSDYPRAEIESALRSVSLRATVVGCTTAGEIGPLGYCRGTVSGFSLSGAVCRAAVGGIDDVATFDVDAGRRLVTALRDRLATTAGGVEDANLVSMLLIDGLSMQEEVVTRNLQAALGHVAVIGGSAGDDLKLQSTWVYHEGAFRTGAAAVVMVALAVPFSVFKTQHFANLGERIVITEADPARRIVHEINGLPADEEYARLVGTERGRLTPELFAAFPVVVVVDGTPLVRSIQKANADGSLTFYSAIEAGLVMQVAHGGSLVDNLQSTVSRLRGEIGEIGLLLSFDCILRRIEIERTSVREQVEAVFRSCNAAGFSTYGEQFGGVHINQTLVGLAIGSGPGGAP